MTTEQKTICSAQCRDTKGKTHRFGKFAASVSHLKIAETVEPATVSHLLKEMFRD